MFRIARAQAYGKLQVVWQAISNKIPRRHNGGYDVLDQLRRLAGSRRLGFHDVTRSRVVIKPGKKCGDEEMIITRGNHKDEMMKHRISKKNKQMQQLCFQSIQ